jgi:hypothetical protein
MNIRIATVAVASIFTAYGCGSSSPTSPIPPAATSPTRPGSSATMVTTQAKPAAAEVSLVSAFPGTPSGDGDWCIGAERVTLTAHVVNTSQSEVTEGTIVWQECDGPQGGLPKEACDGRGPGRWSGVILSDLSSDSTPSIGTSPRVPVLGFRLLYRPAPGSGLKRATSESFNLDQTCTP